MQNLFDKSPTYKNKVKAQPQIIWAAVDSVLQIWMAHC